MTHKHHAQLSDWYKDISTDIFKLAAACNYTPTENQQAKLLRAVQDGRQAIAVRSGQGPGKTRTTGIVALYRLLQAPKAKVILTAPTMKQCKDVWLAELRKLLEGADPLIQSLFEATKTRLIVAGDHDWGVELVTATRPENAQGYHDPNMTIIVEEASGVSSDIMEQFEGTLSNPNSLLLQIGNPNCIMAGMDVYTPENGPVPIEQFSADTVASMQEDSLRIGNQKAHAVVSGKKKCVRVTLASGQQLELSHDHPLFTDEGWQHASKCSDLLVATPSKLLGPSKTTQMEPDLLKFTAYMMADGCTTYQRGNHARCSFTQMPGPVLDEFLSLRIGQNKKLRKERKDGKAMRVDVSGANAAMREIGIAGKSAKTKRVPAAVFRCPDEQIGLFINRFWSCDGSFNRYGPKLCLANRKLLEDMRTLLLRFGIHSRIWHTPVKNTKTFDYLNGRTFDAWTMGITEAESIRLWKKHIGEVLGKEGKCPTPEKTNPNSDVVPIANPQLLEMLDELEETGPTRTALSIKYRRVRRMSTAKFKEFCQETGYRGKYAKYATSDLRWEKVKSIEDIGIRKVYDLTVPATGNFVCENVIVHNTRDCYFFDSFYTYHDRWYCLAWNAEETPASSWFDPERNKRLEKQFGRDSDVYRVRVLGEFPHTDPNCVISAEDFNRCAPSGPEAVQRMLQLARVPYGQSMKHARQMGLDFARFGGDENVCVRRQGGAVVQWGFWPHTDPNDVVDLAFGWQHAAGWTDKGTQYVADAGGMGQGVMMNFHRANKRLFEFHTQAAAFDSQKYGNRMTEAWFCLKERMAERQVHLPSDVLLQRQLTTRQYYMDRKGRIILESKDDFMKRQGDSPDRADATVMAFYPLDLGQARFARKDTAPTQGHQPKQNAPRQQQQQHTARVSRR